MSRILITATWDDNAPHLSAEARREMWASIPDYQKDARTKGIPQLGAGVIFPILEDDLLVDAFALPKHWRRGFGLDVGWNRTAAIWRALDPDTGITYFYDEHYRGGEDPTTHGAIIAQRGLWIPGRIDPAARGRSQKDGDKLLDQYRASIYFGKLPKELTPEQKGQAAQLLKPANNAVESGLYELLIAMQTGKLKVMRGRCPNWLAERRLYRRDERGRVVKKFDHGLDAGRYGFCSGDAWLVAEPAPPSRVEDPARRLGSGSGGNHLSWTGA